MAPEHISDSLGFATCCDEASASSTSTWRRVERQTVGCSRYPLQWQCGRTDPGSPGEDWNMAGWPATVDGPKCGYLAIDNIVVSEGLASLVRVDPSATTLLWPLKLALQALCWEHMVLARRKPRNFTSSLTRDLGATVTGAWSARQATWKKAGANVCRLQKNKTGHDLRGPDEAAIVESRNWPRNALGQSGSTLTQERAQAALRRGLRAESFPQMFRSPCRTTGGTQERACGRLMSSLSTPQVPRSAPRSPQPPARIEFRHDAVADWQASVWESSSVVN